MVTWICNLIQVSMFRVNTSTRKTTTKRDRWAHPHSKQRQSRKYLTPFSQAQGKTTASKTLENLKLTNTHYFLETLTISKQCLSTLMALYCNISNNLRLRTTDTNSSSVKTRTLSNISSRCLVTTQLLVLLGWRLLDRQVIINTTIRLWARHSQTNLDKIK